MADSFDPNANNVVNSIAVKADGKILAGGTFTSIGGQPRSLFAPLSNDTAALQNVAVTQTTITWTRGGSSPQFTRVTFESSTDNVNYTLVGNGTAVGSNWTLTGLSLATGQNIYIRARGYYRSGYENGSESTTESVRNAFLRSDPTPTPTPIPTHPAQPTPTTTPTCPPVITQSTSQAITAGNSASCNSGPPGFFHADNSYWRAFNMATFTGSQQYNVTSVSFGIETANAAGTGTTQPVTVRLYTETIGVFPLGTQTQIATTTVNVADQALTVLTVPLVATVPAGTTELIMEVFTPDGTGAGNRFLIGSNAAGETGPGYTSAASCLILVPTLLTVTGSPNMHLVFNVNGSCGVTPTPTPTVTPTPLPHRQRPLPQQRRPRLRQQHRYRHATATATPTATATATPTATATKHRHPNANTTQQPPPRLQRPPPQQRQAGYAQQLPLPPRLQRPPPQQRQHGYTNSYRTPQRPLPQQRRPPTPTATATPLYSDRHPNSDKHGYTNSYRYPNSDRYANSYRHGYANQLPLQPHPQLHQRQHDTGTPTATPTAPTHVNTTAPHPQRLLQRPQRVRR